MTSPEDRVFQAWCKRAYEAQQARRRGEPPVNLDDADVLRKEIHDLCAPRRVSVVVRHDDSVCWAELFDWETGRWLCTGDKRGNEFMALRSLWSLWSLCALVVAVKDAGDL